MASSSAIPTKTRAKEARYLDLLLSGRRIDGLVIADEREHRDPAEPVAAGVPFVSSTGLVRG